MKPFNGRAAALGFEELCAGEERVQWRYCAVIYSAAAAAVKRGGDMKRFMGRCCD